MKKNLLTLIFALAFTTFSFAQEEVEVPQTQLSLINKIAADWCPPCGGWGWSFFHDLIDDNSEKAILFTAHHSGGLQNPVASSMTSNYGVFGQPRFILNSTDQNATSSNSATTRMTIQEKVNTHAEAAPDVQTGLVATWRDDDMIHVLTNTAFFNDVQGEYYLGVYLVEKTVISNQASVGPNAEHKNILRLELSGNDFGNLLQSGDIAAETSFTNEFAISTEGYDTENLEIVTIIWKKEDNTYVFVNANKDSSVEYEVINALNENELSASFLIRPNIISSTANLDFELKESASLATVNILDVNGRILQTVYTGALESGRHNFELNRADLPVAGHYFVSLNIEGNVVTKMVIIK